MVATQRIVRRDGQPDRTVHACQLLDDQDVIEVRKTGAAVLGGEENPQHPHPPELFHDVPGEFLGLVEMKRHGGDLVLGELPYGLAGQLLFFTQLEFQRRPPGEVRRENDSSAARIPDQARPWVGGAAVRDAPVRSISQPSNWNETVAPQKRRQSRRSIR